MATSHPKRAPSAADIEKALSGDIGRCDVVTFSFSRLPLCFVIYTGSGELTIFIVIVTTARECRDQTGTHISCCKQK